MYFFETEGCHYKCDGKELLLRKNQLAVVNGGDLHSCNEWGTGCRAVCLVVDVKRLALPLLLPLKFENKMQDDGRIKAILEDLQSTLRENPPPPLLDCLVFSAVYSLLGLLTPFASPKEKNGL